MIPLLDVTDPVGVRLLPSVPVVVVGDGDLDGDL